MLKYCLILGGMNRERAFYYNEKISLMPAEGRLKIGDDVFLFEPNTAFGLLDWGRGV